ncbi:MAG: ABC transporter ATP-binding protein [Deltaproteobacteria bacterium]|nr:ABC transporter ATP-binding protein [Candidatus Anaeroferrophillus wilburensis]MBN2889830.1 ABC transporter ATP-binding protein [Deltaproteobacteria bacterium]
MLEVVDIHTFYGLSHILFDVSLEIAEGEIVCLLGRNGAGKSTTMRSIMGLTPAKRGTIHFRGTEITGEKPFRIARRGIGYVPDNRRVFTDLTVGENLDIAARQPDDRTDLWDKEQIYEFFPQLKAINNRRAGFLSGGEQQMLTIGRALMTNPDLLLLDEPTEGLAPLIVALLEEQIMKLKAAGLTVLLAEQNLGVALRLSDRAYVIDNGVIRYQGTIDELREHEEVCCQYLMV